MLELRKFVAPEFIYGTGARNLTGKYCKNLGANKLMLVTDNQVKNEFFYKDVVESIQNENIPFEVFSNISPNPRDYEVMEGAEQFKANKCDFIVAFGGGSVLDCAKGIGIVVSNDKPIQFFEGVDKIIYPMPPLICIPTTGGTSADVSQFAIINNYTEKYKMAIISKAVVPDLALIDPETLLSMSSFLTSCTALDALSHAFEAFVSNANSPFTDLYALEAVQLIYKNLIPTLENPNDMDLRSNIMLGSLYAGLAFSNTSLGCVHSLAHSLGGYLDLPHGECNAILLPHVVDYNFDHAEERYRKLGELFGISSASRSVNEYKKILVEKLIHFKERVGVAKTLKDNAVTSDMLSVLASRAIKDPCNATNPRVPNLKDLEVIYQESL
jgi:alcohol dehydrogenase